MSAPRPWFILAGGINGAGKSTFAQSRSTLQRLDAELDVEFEIINPDLVTKKLRAAHPGMSEGAANLQAALDCEAQVRMLIAEGKRSFSIETVLSTDKYKKIVELALAKGFRVFFVYVLLGSADEAVARVARRVERGGHDVPEQKIRDRWPKSLANLTWFWKKATKAVVMFNGDCVDSPYLVAARSKRSTRVDTDAFALMLPKS